jgi:hypothetical protein
MLVEIHDRLRNPLTVRATRVLLMDDAGFPFAFCVESSPGHYRVFTAKDKEFNEALADHGIDRTVVATTLDPRTLRAV